jgi:peptidoglycan-associated lipoprotein
MMNIIRYTFLLLLLFVTSGLLAQPILEATLEQNLKTAQEQLDRNDYYNARTYFEKAYDQDKNPYVAQVIAELNTTLRDYRRAESWYKRILRRDKEDLFVEARYDYANVLKSRGKYEDAFEQYEYYMEKGKDEAKKDMCRRQILGMQLASAMEEDVSIVVENVGRPVNDRFVESSPAMDEDGTMYFATIRADDVIVIDKKAENYHSRIYSASPEDDERKAERKPWKEPVELSEEINREGFHAAGVSISNDGSRMYFTRATLGGNDVDSSVAYVSFRKAKGWGAPQFIEGVNGDYIVRHPAPGELYGNQVLFFSSNMEGGEGGYDLYYCTREGDAKYSLPTNLGPEINTPGDEVTPFYQAGVLYFSSNGHPTIGGFDVFQTTWDGSNWSEVENMGLAFNTTYDDLDLSYNSDGSKGFMVSNRPGTTTRSVGSKTCCDDIWSVKKREIVIDVIATIVDEDGKELTGVTGTMTNLGDRKAEVDKKDSGEKNTLQFGMDAESAYKLVLSKDGYTPEEEEFNTVGKLDDYTYKRKYVMKKIPVADDEEVITINEPIRLSNIYYDFDDDKILPASEPDLERLLGLLNKYDDMEIELGSHTDSQGRDEYNRNLSERRAESAKRWLVERGIDEARIDAVGYGEEQILNKCKNGIPCTDDEHRFNRRTEFKITAGPTSIIVKKQKN